MTRAHVALFALTLALAGCGQVASPQALTGAPAVAAKAAPTYGLTAIRVVGKHKGDYLPAHNWKIEIDGVIVGGFEEVIGLEEELAEFRNGDDPITHKRAGKTKYKNIVLKRGFVNDASLLDGLSGSTERKSGSVIYLDRAGNEVLRASFFEAWPCRAALEAGAPGLQVVAELELPITETVVFRPHRGEVK